MNDLTKTIIGLALFLAVILFPIWYNAVSDQDPGAPDPIIDRGAEGRGGCVMEGAWMKTEHMDLLMDWRDEVVREDDRVFIAEDGRKFNKSLTHTCLDCHSNKDTFCDRCHTYMAVDPYCWECHIQTSDLEVVGGER